ncbi:MAG: nucleotidyltransferase domain-containing protein [Acidobacteria bacterium]|nr:nucleotidyltransferase domain-containing protein [Acidobacteriota bacterium]
MPVRSLNSSVLKWPDAASVTQAVLVWAGRMARTHPGIRRIGYFGSYARGDWGVGSDLDLVVIRAEGSDAAITGGELAELPVPADMLSYDERQFENLRGRGRFGRVLDREVVWVFSKEPDECDQSRPSTAH